MAKGIAKHMLLMVLGVVLGQGAWAQADIFVKAGTAPGGNGTSWATAFATLQEGLAQATAGDRVLVARGDYMAFEISAEVAFTVPGGVTVIGGLEGNEAVVDEATLAGRDLLNNVTRLTADVFGDDLGGSEGNKIDNAQTVVAITAGGPVILDGLSLENGNNIDGLGGGLLAMDLADALTLRNITVADNFGQQGGGLALVNVTAVLEAVTVIRNEAEQGGGAYLKGATVNWNSAQVLANFASGHGGGVYVEEPGPFTWNEYELRSNSAGGHGGGVYVGNGDWALDWTFGLMLENAAEGDGGALYLADDAMAINEAFSVQHLSAIDNAAAGSGHMAYLASGGLTIANSLLWDRTLTDGLIDRNTNESVLGFDHCLVLGSGGSGAAWAGGVYGFDEGGNLDEDPVLVDSLWPSTIVYAHSPLVGAAKADAPGSNIGYYQGAGIVGLNDELPGTMKLWPNPASGGAVVQLEVDLPEGQPLTVSIWNALGQLQAMQELLYSGGKQVLYLSTAQMEVGVYYVQLTGTRGVRVLPLLVE